jgi:hypothetical protein
VSLGVDGEADIDINAVTRKPAFAPERLSAFTSLWIGRFNFQATWSTYAAGRELSALVQVPVVDLGKGGEVWVGISANANLERRASVYPQSIMASLTWFLDGGSKYARASGNFIVETAGDKLHTHQGAPAATGFGSAMTSPEATGDFGGPTPVSASASGKNPMWDAFQAESSLAGFAKELGVYGTSDKMGFLSFLNMIAYNSYDLNGQNSISVAVSDPESMYRSIRKSMIGAGGAPTGDCGNMSLLISRVAALWGWESYVAKVPGSTMGHVVTIVRDPDSSLYTVIGENFSRQTISELLAYYSVQGRRKPLMFPLYSGNTGKLVRVIETPLGEDLDRRMGTPRRLEQHLRGRD